MGQIMNYSRKGWIIMSSLVIAAGLVSGLAQFIREGGFGDDMVWTANWFIVLYLVVGSSLLFIFRKDLYESEQEPENKA